MKRINGIFISLIGMLALSMSLMAQDVATVTDGVPETNYEDLFASLAAIVAGVPVIVEAIRGFWKSMPGWVAMALNWVLGVGICMFGWWQDLGFLADLDWQIALMYGIGAGRNRPDTMADLALHPQEKERGVGHGMGRAFRLPRCRRWIAYPASVAFRHPPAEAGAEKGS